MYGNMSNKRDQYLFFIVEAESRPMCDDNMEGQLLAVTILFVYLFLFFLSQLLAKQHNSLLKITSHCSSNHKSRHYLSYHLNLWTYQIFDK